ncbi:hypothetical protein CGC54_10105 [Capnocytophaga canimorsus]|uniref:Uncharacterized protein n=1 Tax=Capnocytophaga canimorsus TaxID=28188 RepID=A0AAD0EAX2_9FLAO|nr:hypothetical protein [Capnocytophaga canimorsus]ATA94657.1 hypothetical protein CGC54_10105 [Capnocytophaga canimorsus]
MTTAEMLASLEAQIRKDIPRLMEFKEGFIIENNNTQVKLLSSNYEFDKECIVHLFVNTEIFWYLTDEDLKECKFIGHDIMLNDVFQWLFMNDNLHDIRHIFIDGTLIPKSGGIDYGLHINFDSPYLKDQSEELINFLYKIKNE